MHEEEEDYGEALEEEACTVADSDAGGGDLG